jgi:hypothetical protein
LDGFVTPYYGTLKEAGREKDLRTVGERSVIEESGRSLHELRFLAAHRQE